MVLEDGVIEGRKTFCNMLKYLKMTASSTTAACSPVLVASAFLPFHQVLCRSICCYQNLMYDISQAAIPFDNVDEELLKKHGMPTDLGRFMVFLVRSSSLFDIAMFAIMAVHLQANAPEHRTLFQSGWFIGSLLSRTLIVHMIRAGFPSCKPRERPLWP